jgi:hypothetical protein
VGCFSHTQSQSGPSSGGRDGGRNGGREGGRDGGTNIVQIQPCQDIKAAEVSCVQTKLQTSTPSVDLAAIKKCFDSCVRTPSARTPNADPKKAAFEACISTKAQSCIEQGAQGVQFVKSGDRVEHNWNSYGWGGKGDANADIVGRLLNASSKCGVTTQTCVTKALPPNAQANSASLSASFKTSLCNAYQSCNSTVYVTVIVLKFIHYFQ